MNSQVQTSEKFFPKNKQMVRQILIMANNKTDRMQADMKTNKIAKGMLKRNFNTLNTPTVSSKSNKPKTLTSSTLKTSFANKAHRNIRPKIEIKNTENKQAIVPDLNIKKLQFRKKPQSQQKTEKEYNKSEFSETTDYLSVETYSTNLTESEKLETVRKLRQEIDDWKEQEELRMLNLNTSKRRFEYDFDGCSEKAYISDNLQTKKSDIVNTDLDKVIDSPRSKNKSSLQVMDTVRSRSNIGKRIPRASWVSFPEGLNKITLRKSPKNMVPKTPKSNSSKRIICLSPATLGELEKAEKLIEEVEKQLPEITYQTMLLEVLQDDSLNECAITDDQLYIRKIVATTFQKGRYDPPPISSSEKKKRRSKLAMINKKLAPTTVPISLETSDVPQTNLEEKSKPKNFENVDMVGNDTKRDNLSDTKPVEELSRNETNKNESFICEKFKIQKGPDINIRGECSIQTGEIVDIKPKKKSRNFLSEMQNFRTISIRHKNCESLSDYSLTDESFERNIKNSSKMSRDFKENEPPHTLSVLKDLNANKNSGIEMKNSTYCIFEETEDLDVSCLSLEEPQVFEIDTILHKQRDLLSEVKNAAGKLDEYLLKNAIFETKTKTREVDEGLKSQESKIHESESELSKTKTHAREPENKNCKNPKNVKDLATHTSIESINSLKNAQSTLSHSDNKSTSKISSEGTFGSKSSNLKISTLGSNSFLNSLSSYNSSENVKQLKDNFNLSKSQEHLLNNSSVDGQFTIPIVTNIYSSKVTDAPPNTNFIENHKELNNVDVNTFIEKNYFQENITADDDVNETEVISNRESSTEMKNSKEIEHSRQSFLEELEQLEREIEEELLSRKCDTVSENKVLNQLESKNKSKSIEIFKNVDQNSDKTSNSSSINVSKTSSSIPNSHENRSNFLSRVSASANGMANINEQSDRKALSNNIDKALQMEESLNLASHPNNLTENYAGCTTAGVPKSKDNKFEMSNRTAHVVNDVKDNNGFVFPLAPGQNYGKALLSILEDNSNSNQELLKNQKTNILGKLNQCSLNRSPIGRRVFSSTVLSGFDGSGFPKIKEMSESSSETHSEGEIQISSSGTYSLGEIRSQKSNRVLRNIGVGNSSNNSSNTSSAQTLSAGEVSKP